MRNVLVTYTGNAGKTMIASHMLKRKMPDAAIVAVESINETAKELGLEVTKLPGERFRDVFAMLLNSDDLIVDVGASNVEDFMSGLSLYGKAQNEVDCFLVPVIPGTKEQKEAIAMVLALQNMGVDPSRIKIIFNRASGDTEYEFEILFKYAKAHAFVTLNPDATILENDLFDRLSRNGCSLQSVLDDQTNYVAKIRELRDGSNPKLAKKYTDAYCDLSIAETVAQNLDEVYEALFGNIA